MRAYNFDANVWEKLPIPDPVPLLRVYVRMVYVADSDRTLLYGGFPAGGDQTWAYDTNTNAWVRMESPDGLSRLS